MRKVLTAGFAMAVALSAMGPASADPARSSSAGAFGITATLSGTTLIAPTPTAVAAAPPDASEERNSTVPLTAGTLTITGALNAVAQARQADELVFALTPAVLAGAPAGSSEPITLTAPNTRAFGSAANASVLVSSLAGLPADAFEFVQSLAGSLVSAGAVQAEAVAKCVGGRPQFDTGFNVVDLRLAGTQIPLVGDLVTTVVDLLGPTNPLAGLIAITKGEVVPLADGVGINALRVSVLGSPGGTPLLSVVIGHAEVHMPTDCAVAAPAPPTGPGDVAPTGNLAATGGDFSVTPIVAMVLLGGAFAIRRLTVRARRSSTTVA